MKAEDIFFTEEMNNLEAGTYFDAEFNGKDSLQLTRGSVSLMSKINQFKGKRKKVKAVFKKNIDGKGVWQLVYWADLHGHTSHSMLDSIIRPKQKAAHTEYVSAITDHGNMGGTLEFFTEMKKAEKQAILGTEVYSESIDGEKLGFHLILLAKNLKGYKNLIKLSSLSARNFYQKPQVSYEMLENYSEGIIATSSCICGEIARNICRGHYENAKRVALKMKDIFGEDYYLEVQNHQIHNDVENEIKINAGVLALGQELNIKVIATANSHYVKKEDEKAHQVHIMIGDGKKFTDDSYRKFCGTNYHIQSYEEMLNFWGDYPELLDNTLEIAEKCSRFQKEFDEYLGKFYMPEFKCPDNHSEESYFVQLCHEGFDLRFKGKPEHKSKEYKERFNFELETIRNMGFFGYFLIVWDIIRFCREKSIVTGPGRGSVVGSLLAYCLQITEVDPIPNGLLFERFLNPDRVSMPDIDLDFEAEKRGEVFKYVGHRYGESNVSKIITRGTLSAKAVFKDVCRVYGLSFMESNNITKTIPNVPNLSISEAMDKSDEFKNICDREDLKEIVDTCLKLEGLQRNASVHACGVLVAPTEISDYLPTTQMEDKKSGTGEKEETSQYEKDECEKMGLVKLDFLGLRTMSVISRCLRLIKERYGIDMNYSEIPLTDKKSYELISKGLTDGIFQIESPGMKNLMKELFKDYKQMKDGSTDFFERLQAGVALYRPGPMDYIPDYLENMRNPKSIQYDHKCLEPILKNTYGTIVYQEQSMMIVREMAGFTKGESDNVRKAFGKKIKEMIEPLGEKFKAGCLKNNISEEVAETVWHKMESFGSYAFNKSHSCAYTVISVCTAWLKTYYPVEFMASVLNSYLGKQDKLKNYLHATKKMGIKILPPDINKSEDLFSIEGDSIRFGFQALKSLGATSVAIKDERILNGDYDSVHDFIKRMVRFGKINKGTCESMIFSGCFDSFGLSRRSIDIVLPELLSLQTSLKKEEAKIKNQISFFDLEDGLDEDEVTKQVTIPRLAEAPKDIRLLKEREYAGMYITAHPLDDYEQYFIDKNIVNVVDLLGSNEDHEEINESNDQFIGKKVKIACCINEVELKQSKNGGTFKILKVEDRTGEINCMIFKSALEKISVDLREGSVIFLTGKLTENDFGRQIIVQVISDISQLSEDSKPKKIIIKTDNQLVLKNFKNKDFSTFLKKGETPFYVNLNGENHFISKVSSDFGLFSKLRDKFRENLIIQY